MILAAGHFVLASWVLAAAFFAFTVALVVAVVSSWLQHREPPRRPGVFESVFRLREEGLIDRDVAQAILHRYDELIPDRLLLNDVEIAERLL